MGLQPQDPADPRRAVPPRIHRHRGRPRSCWPTSSTWPACSAPPRPDRRCPTPSSRCWRRLADGATLSEDDADAFFAACLRGEPTPAQVGAAVTAMRMRGETVGEITACARAMRRGRDQLDQPYDVIDVCGTGGDGLHTLNISTAVGLRGRRRRA